MSAQASAPPPLPPAPPGAPPRPPPGPPPTAPPETPEVDRARGTLIRVVAVLVAIAAFWAIAEGIRSTDVTEFRVKAWLALVALVAACVQILTMSRVYGWIPFPPGAVPTIARVHRWSGRTALFFAGLTFYLCVTGGYPDGFAWHRLTGLLLAAVLLCKFTILRGAPPTSRWSGFLPWLGFAAFLLILAQFMSKAVENLF